MNLHNFHANYLTSVSLKSGSSVYDMNELPYMSQLRSMLLVVCAVMFFTAACVYMPLGNIQADYDGKCFLDTKLRFELDKRSMNLSNPESTHRLRLNPVSTTWGPILNCNFTTFTSVMVAIFSMVIGWSTFTVWPTMMEIGKGGVLMLVYAFLFTLCLGCTIVSTVILSNGYKQTCKSMARAGMACNQLNTQDVNLKAKGEIVIVRDVNKAIIIAQVASAALVGLSCLQIIVSLTTFGTIWFHFHYLAVQMYNTSPSIDRWPNGSWPRDYGEKRRRLHQEQCWPLHVLTSLQHSRSWLSLTISWSCLPMMFRTSDAGGRPLFFFPSTLPWRAVDIESIL